MENKNLPAFLRAVSFRGYVLILIILFVIVVWSAFGAASCHYAGELEKAQNSGVQSSVDVVANSVQAEQDDKQAPIVLTYKADNTAMVAQLEGLKDEIAKLPPSASSDVDPDLTRVVLTGLCRDKARSDGPDCSAYRQDTR